MRVVLCVGPSTGVSPPWRRGGAACAARRKGLQRAHVPRQGRARAFFEPKIHDSIVLTRGQGGRQEAQRMPRLCRGARTPTILGVGVEPEVS